MKKPIARPTMLSLACIFGSIVFTVYGQIIVKWQVMKAGPFPTGLPQRATFLLNLLLNPWIMSGIMAGFFALLCWMTAMTKLELSYAYPFMSLAFLLVLVLSAVIFKEPVTVPKILGLALVIAGILVASR